MVTDVEGLGDQSKNDAAYRGLMRFKEQYNATVTVKESPMITDYIININLLAEEGYDIVLASGNAMHDSVAEAAERSPNTKFVLLDSVVDSDNVASVTFKENEGSFLVGLLAAMKTNTNKIGFIGGEDISLIHKYEVGFIAGVKAVNPDAQVIVNYTGDPSNINKGKELALAQYSQGVDIIYHACGQSGIGVIRAASEQGAGYYVIGSNEPQAHLAPESVLTSMVKSIDSVVFNICESLIHGNWKSGHEVFGL